MTTAAAAYPEVQELITMISDGIKRVYGTQLISHKILAERCGVSLRTVGNWRYKGYLPQQERHAIALFRVLGISNELERWRAWRSTVVEVAGGRPTIGKELRDDAVIGRWLRSKRLGREWTQARLGKEIGVSSKTVAAWEAERREIDRGHRLILREVLGELPPEAGAAAS